jgi:hypothetical protein
MVNSGDLSDMRQDILAAFQRSGKAGRVHLPVPIGVSRDLLGVLYGTIASWPEVASVSLPVQSPVNSHGQTYPPPPGYEYWSVTFKAPRRVCPTCGGKA